MDGINNRQRSFPMPIGQTEYYYPSFVASDSDESELPAGVARGNWGKKAMKGARWVRRGKAAAWGPNKGEWEVEERARKRLQQLMEPPRSPSPPTLSHLREMSPPLGAPYARPASTHGSYSAFVLDPAMAHSYRTHLLGDLQQTTENLIQGEATLSSALGRLWKVLSEEEHVFVDNNEVGSAEGVDVAKREEGEDDDDDMSDRGRRLARAPDVTPPSHKLFLTPFLNEGTNMLEPSHFGSPQMQLENMEKSFGALRELQDDSREYVERLQEIRESLGEVRRQRDLLWMKIREQALEELKSIDQQDVDADVDTEL
ncbi:hypothetical protein EW145_g1701 [Phellinidium pouzarii]|uniref:Uncharacterized protein n=1 Tax=Phellinidium pouzarii TaxID=167371 RepID=A0A4S4LDR8_9AGAM|nr:hypothetical protein EW145_g1701 [Phellinidium pouzarii]